MHVSQGTINLPYAEALAKEALVILDDLKIRGRPASPAKTKKPIVSAAQAPTSQADPAGPVHESQTTSPEAAQPNTAIAEKFAALTLEPWPPREWIYNPENPD
ncbi:hypothetical protein DL767_010254 [Monosporascus sp. MG133]|nr:hypothetical protein DL767_010254 [Monosporascus sp. MG133]